LFDGFRSYSRIAAVSWLSSDVPFIDHVTGFDEVRALIPSIVTERA
jgi:hypothetical protein